MSLSRPPDGLIGDNDEEAAEKQMDAEEPNFQRGASKGSRDKKGRGHSSPSMSSSIFKSE